MFSCCPRSQGKQTNSCWRHFTNLNGFSFSFKIHLHQRNVAMKTIATLTMAICFHETQGAKVSRVTVAVDTSQILIFPYFLLRCNYITLACNTDNGYMCLSSTRSQGKYIHSNQSFRSGILSNEISPSDLHQLPLISEHVKMIKCDHHKLILI